MKALRQASSVQLRRTSCPRHGRPSQHTKMPSSTRLSSIFTDDAAAATAFFSRALAQRGINAALFAAADRSRSGTLGPEDAHHLFDELLQHNAPVRERALNGFLAALARAPPSAACIDGPALAVSLFNRLSRCAAGPWVAPPTLCTYNILIDCCSRARCPDLGLAYFGRLLRTGLGVDVVTFNNLLKCLGYAKRMDEAVEVLLHKMPELGCIPNGISYSAVVKSFCNNRRSQGAHKLLRKMAENGRTDCSPTMVMYNTVIDGFFKEGEVAKACNLFHEMMQQGISPDVVTYTLVIGALCKAKAMDKAEMVLQQMLDKGIQPDDVTYNSVMHGYSTLGQWKKASKVFKEMTVRGVQPNIVTWNSFMASLCKHGRNKEARDFLDSMPLKGQRPNIISYCILLHAYATDGCMVDLTDLFNLMVAEGIVPDHNVFNILINAYGRQGMMAEAMNILKEMTQQGVKPDIVSYSTVIAALCRKGRMDDAMEMFNQMMGHGVPPDGAIYHLLILGYCTHGSVLKAKVLASEMMNKGMCPDIVCFGSLINTLCKEGRAMEAEEIFDFIIHIGLRPNVIVYSALMDGNAAYVVSHSRFQAWIKEEGLC
jgi:pentatricopeptide repeat protein